MGVAVVVALLLLGGVVNYALFVLLCSFYSCYCGLLLFTLLVHWLPLLLLVLLVVA